MSIIEFDTTTVTIPWDLFEIMLDAQKSSKHVNGTMNLVKIPMTKVYG